MSSAPSCKQPEMAALLQHVEALSTEIAGQHGSA